MTLKVYTKDGCPRCVALKKRLSDASIPFKEVKIGVDVDREVVLSTFPDQRMLPFVVRELNNQVLTHTELEDIIDG